MLMKVERISLAVLVLHERVELALLRILPPYEWDLMMLLYQFPSTFAWVCLAASLLVWVADPLSSNAAYFLGVLQAAALRGHWRLPIAGSS
mmetsp:Transcript_100632/g.323089  ORF Transcript_100632/g.323089 Transcript_100632/m.323089 type:complete len:91 (+) Transcript_100632:743-1015(+)